MSETSSATPEPINAVHQLRRRNNRRAVYVVGAVLALVAACVTGYVVAANSRYTVTGKADPAGGYGIEYTVSSWYSKSVELRLDRRSSVSGFVFNPKPPPQSVRWIYTHILHRRLPQLNRSSYGWELGAIRQSLWSAQNEITFNQQGFPEVSVARKVPGNVVEDNIRVSGCKATWCTYSLPGTAEANLRFYRLYVRLKDQPMILSFTTVDDETDPTGVIDELMKIKKSIHITKGK